MNFDLADLRILTAMQINARISLESLADKAALSTASVQRRLKRLRDGGVIQKDVAIIDQDKVGQPMSFIIMVELERERRDQIAEFTKSAQAEPQVQQCYYITGEADFCLICTARDMADFEELTHRLFFDNNNVRRFRTSVVMGRKKIGLSISLGDVELSN